MKCTLSKSSETGAQAIETYIQHITRAQKIEWYSVEQLQLVIEPLNN
ncbi:hypothetical protein [Bilophila wadsworthia]|nr:hypothetical protein [Bilophila wadsworthia]